MAILLPKKVAHRKVRKGKNEGVATRCNTVAFGDYGLMSLDNERINSRQIEAARRAITREMKRLGQLWIRIFPDVPVSDKPAEVRMGKGKGSIEFWVARVKPGRILFECGGVSEEIARSALTLGAAKLPIKTKFVKKLNSQLGAE